MQAGFYIFYTIKFDWNIYENWRARPCSRKTGFFNFQCLEKKLKLLKIISEEQIYTELTNELICM